MEVVFKVLESANEDIILECINCVREIFFKEPYLVIKAYESGFDFQILVDAVKNGDPEMAQAGIDFWDKFIMIDTIIYKEEFKRNLFE